MPSDSLSVSLLGGIFRCQEEAGVGKQDYNESREQSTGKLEEFIAALAPQSPRGSLTFL